MSRERASVGKSEGAGKAPAPGRGGRGRGRDSARGLDLQDAVGNRAVGRMLASGRGAPVGVTPASGVLQRKCAACSGGGAPCPSCLEEAPIQRKAKAGGETAPSGAGAGAARSSGSGRPLDPGTRGFMASRFGHDFDGVRVHTDGQAAASADRLRAHAYTVGQDIYFGAGRYQPDTHAGRHLLAHELTHTLQQRAGGSGGGAPQASRAVSQPGDPLEREADAIADRVLSGGPGACAPTSAGPAPGIQRYSFEEFLDDADAAISEAGEVIADTASDVADGVGDVVGTVRDTTNEAIDTAVEIAGDAAGVVLDAAGAILDEARALAAAIGGMVSITSAGVEIHVPPMSVCPVIPLRFDLPEIGQDLWFPVFALPISPNVLIDGEVGLHVGATQELSVQVGPCLLHGLHVVINPITGSYRASGGLTTTVVTGIGGEPHVGLFGEVGATVLWPDPPFLVHIPVIRLEGGLAGVSRGMAVETVTAAGSLAYSGGDFSLGLRGSKALGLAVDWGLAGYGGLSLLGMNLCTLYWPLVEWHDDLVLTTSLGVDFSAGLGGISMAVDYRPPMVSTLEFADLPVALTRDMLIDDCPICDVMYALGLFPSQLGGPWPHHPGPPLPGPLHVYPVDPGVTSGSLCRGACGPDCDTCDVTPEVLACEDLGDGRHALWRYTTYSDCPTHQGCRAHDACYDWCADQGEMAIWGPCHRVCDLECVCEHSGEECVGWIGGSGGDDRMVFAEDAQPIGGCRGDCSQVEIAPAGLGARLCLPDLVLFDPVSVSDGVGATTGKVYLPAIEVEIPYIGPVTIAPYVRGSARASISGTVGPAWLANLCLEFDRGLGVYRGTIEFHLKAGLKGRASVTGSLGAEAIWLCLLEVLDIEGGLTARAGADLDTEFVAAAAVSCQDGELVLDAGLTFRECLELFGNLNAFLNVTLFDRFTVLAETWKLGEVDWRKCWEQTIEVASGRALAPAPSAAGTPGALGAPGGAGSAGSVGAAVAGPTSGSTFPMLHSGALDAVSLVTGLFGIASNDLSVPALPSDPAAESGSENPCPIPEPGPCEVPPGVDVTLKLPPQKAIYLGLYRSLVGARELHHSIDREDRDTNQLDKWEEHMTNEMPVETRCWGVALGLDDDDILRPRWSQRRLLPRRMGVDHVIEWQVRPLTGGGWVDEPWNFEMLDASSNSSSGPRMRGNINREREDLASTTGDASWLSRDLCFTKVDTEPRGDAERWAFEQVVEGDHFEAFERITRRRRDRNAFDRCVDRGGAR